MAGWRFLLSRAAFDNVDYFFYLSSSRTPRPSFAPVHTFALLVLLVWPESFHFSAAFTQAPVVFVASLDRAPRCFIIFFSVISQQPSPFQAQPARVASVAERPFLCNRIRTLGALPTLQASVRVVWLVSLLQISFFCAALSTVWPAVGRILSLL